MKGKKKANYCLGCGILFVVLLFLGMIFAVIIVVVQMGNHQALTSLQSPGISPANTATTTLGQNYTPLAGTPTTTVACTAPLTSTGLVSSFPPDNGLAKTQASEWIPEGNNTWQYTGGSVSFYVPQGYKATYQGNTYTAGQFLDADGFELIFVGC